MSGETVRVRASYDNEYDYHPSHPIKVDGFADEGRAIYMRVVTAKALRKDLKKAIRKARKINNEGN